jgi:hypothetical protein
MIRWWQSLLAVLAEWVWVMDGPELGGYEDHPRRSLNPGEAVLVMGWDGGRS